MATYKVINLQTKWVIITTGDEKIGDPVISENSIPCIPAHSDLTFSARVSGPTTFVTVKGKAGHFINVNEHDGRLVWGDDSKYEWQVSSTAAGTYRFYPKNGKDLYWYQNQQILDKVGAKGGSLLTQDEPFFVLI